MRDIQNIMATVVMMSIKFETSGEGTRPGLPSQESALHGAAKATQTNVNVRRKKYGARMNDNGVGNGFPRRGQGGQGLCCLVAWACEVGVEMDNVQKLSNHENEEGSAAYRAKKYVERGVAANKGRAPRRCRNLQAAPSAFSATVTVTTNRLF